MQESKHEAVAATMGRINRAWLDGQVEDLGPLLHPEVVMVVPGFSPQPAFLQHQEPQGQHGQRLMMVPATPALHLLFSQSHFLLAAQETLRARRPVVRQIGLAPDDQD